MSEKKLHSKDAPVWTMRVGGKARRQESSLGQGGFTGLLRMAMHSAVSDPVACAVAV